MFSKIKNDEIQNIFDSIPVIVILKDLNGKILKVNKKFCSTFGFTHQEVENQPIYDIFDQESAEKCEENSLKVIESGTPLEFTESLIDKNGNKLWFQMIKIPRVDSNGECNGIISLAVDISKSKENEYLLKTSEETYKTLVKFATDSIVLVDIDLNLVLYNNSFLKILESLKSFNNLNEKICISNILDDINSKKIFKYIKDNRIKYIKEEIIINNVFYSMSYCPININSHFEGGIFIFHDISEMKIKEDFMKNVNEKLKKSNKELESFVYIVSHDLKAPARQISMFADMINSCDNEEEKKIFSKKIKEVSNKMQNLIDDLLNFSMISKNKNIKINELSIIVNEVKNSLESDIKKNNAIIELFGDIFIEADKTHLEQMFINLISNSIKFKKDNTSPKIKITCKTNQIIIEDNGIGFENQYRYKIFEIFNRIYTDDKYEGTGIGLAICKKIADRYGWNIEAEGSPGYGSKFVITIQERTDNVK